MIIKRWRSSNKVLKRYEPYHIVDFGLSWIKPHDICALSLPLKNVRCDEKLQRLKSSVIAIGWNDQYPSDLHLYRLPNGLFVVGSGGNHRAYLANKLSISIIQAYVSIMIPDKLISNSIMQRIEDCLNTIETVSNKIQELNKLELEASIKEILSLQDKKMEYLRLIEELAEYKHHLLFFTAESLGFLPR